MAIITFDLEDLARLGISKKDVEYSTDRLGMSLESIDEKGATIDITPNRPDMLDIIGFARAVKFLMGKTVPKEKSYSLERKPLLTVDASAAARTVQPYISLAAAKNVNLGGNNLKNLINFTEKFCDTYGRKRKKLSMGLYNLDSVSGNLTYTAAKKGEFAPLGSRKNETLKQILETHPKGVAYADILDKSVRYPVLKDERNILALIPIINSESTKVTENTKNLLIDITASTRYAAEAAMNMFACSFIDMGADVYPCNVVYKKKSATTPDLKYREIKIKRAKAELTLGFYLAENKVINLTNKLGHVSAKYGNDTLVYVPPYRLDVLNEQDIIEDIVIAYGYGNIAPMPLGSTAIGIPDIVNEYSNKVGNFMVGLGYTEAMNMYLTNEELNFKRFGRQYDEASVISIAYSKTEAITMLRTALLPCLMENLGNSVHERMPQRIFEIGKTFNLNKGKVIEKLNFAAVSEHSKANYSEMKAVATEFLKFTGIKDYRLVEYTENAFIDGRAARIMLKDQTIGHIGEINPKILRNFRLEEPVVALEIDLDRCIGSAST